MPLRPVRDLAIRSDRDAQRVKSRQLLDEMYARMDAQMAEALGEDVASPPSSSREVS